LDWDKTRSQITVKAVDLGNLAGLVVAAQERNPVRMADLEGNEEKEGLERVVPSIDIVA
jgi:hypothetical protein